jgi:hypothetical protein
LVFTRPRNTRAALDPSGPKGVEAFGQVLGKVSATKLAIA